MLPSTAQRAADVALEQNKNKRKLALMQSKRTPEEILQTYSVTKSLFSPMTALHKAKNVTKTALNKDTKQIITTKTLNVQSTV